MRAWVRFQDPRLLPWRTVMANLGSVQRERDGWQRRAQHYLDLVGLSHVADRFPAQLSGGQQQRIGIARAFSVEPDVLLMDEPFSHLDAMTSRTLREHLERIWLETRRTVMFVTHDVTEAVQLSDRIVVLAPGGQVHEIIDVDLPRPRRASDPAVAVMQAEVLRRSRLSRSRRESCCAASARCGRRPRPLAARRVVRPPTGHAASAAARPRRPAAPGELPLSIETDAMSDPGRVLADVAAAGLGSRVLSAPPFAFPVADVHGVDD